MILPGLLIGASKGGGVKSKFFFLPKLDYLEYILSPLIHLPGRPFFLEHAKVKLLMSIINCTGPN